MSQLPELPEWAAIATALLVLVGAASTLLGCVGLLRLRTFYERVHAPTLGSSAGTVCIALASMLCFTVLGARLAVHELLIIALVTVTTPVTFVTLTRAALLRDRAEGAAGLPPPRNQPIQNEK